MLQKGLRILAFVMNLYVYVDGTTPRVVRFDQSTLEEDGIGYPFGTFCESGTIGNIIKIIDKDDMFFVEFVTSGETLPVSENDRIEVSKDVTLP